MREYYIDLGIKDVRKNMYSGFIFDKDGVPKYQYKFGSFYNITFICHYALYHISLYNKFQRNEDIEIFMKICDWIIDNGYETEDNFVFYYNFPFSGMCPPWISALGQGRIMSVLTRAYEYTNNNRYLEVAKKALKPFEISTKNGGVRTQFPDGGVAFEEYPRKKPNIVLNGFITSLFGIYDLFTIGKSSEAGILFNEAIESLEKNIHLYDLGYWTAYDITRPKEMVNRSYQYYHNIQLWMLYEITGKEIFRYYSRKWDSYNYNMFVKGMRFFSRVNKKIYNLFNK